MERAISIDKMYLHILSFGVTFYFFHFYLFFSTLKQYKNISNHFIKKDSESSTNQPTMYILYMLCRIHLISSSVLIFQIIYPAPDEPLYCPLPVYSVQYLSFRCFALTWVICPLEKSKTSSLSSFRMIMLF